MLTLGKIYFIAQKDIQKIPKYLETNIHFQITDFQIAQKLIKKLKEKLESISN